MKRIRAKRVISALLASIYIWGAPAFAQAYLLSAAAQTKRTSSSKAVYVKIGTTMRVRLEDRISSKDSRAGDRFTATILDPSRYRDGRVRGHVASIRKSSKFKGRTTMVLAFDSIELNGRTGRMHGQVLRVYESDGESASKVDDEGRVESGSRGKQTLKRGGIGAAAGAVLGGIVGGGKGAAIGILVGGAAGAGSIAVQGSKGLELEAGTEMLIRVTR